MIFATLEERDKAFKTVENREDFPDLKEEQNASIRGMYWAIETLENMTDDYEEDNILDKIRSEITKEAIEDAINAIEVDIVEMYVAFMDDNASEEESDD